ncbi:MAG TPA: amino acid permease [Candidatus Polarisedimenticolia bacterium]|nr:amino acid permease [Candidatus Polarisedimenticolia bacterium]
MASQYFRRKPLDVLMREMEGGQRLRRALGPVALTAMGVGAIIGTGIFVLVGVAAHDKTGPALMLSFVLSGVACIFAALCYAEFASMVPVAGSAYTYAYATLGELFAWIIGWDLILEYAVASSTVAHGWSHYFQDFIGLFGMKIPEVLSRSPFDYDPTVGHLVSTGAWFDLPAVVIAGLVTVILVIGIKESASFNAVMVVIKLAIVLFVIAVGAFYVNPQNWVPFAPFGLTGISFFGKTIAGQSAVGGEPLGMMAGAAVIFFAYIGFDAVSTQAEEAKNPKRDVPIGIIASLILCTLLYIAVAAVLTGMVKYDQINIDAPVSTAFGQVGLSWARYLISIGALTGITSVLLVMMLSQPRIFLAMARDGLLPRKFFAAVHEKFRTPYKATILTGIFVAVVAAIVPLRILAELVNIGTLLAFVLVCGAVLVMRKKHPEAERPFRAPWVPFTPIAGIGLCLLLMFSLPPENWVRLVVWLAIGFVIYFMYGQHHSIMSKENGK